MPMNAWKVVEERGCRCLQVFHAVKRGRCATNAASGRRRKLPVSGAGRPRRLHESDGADPGWLHQGGARVPGRLHQGEAGGPGRLHQLHQGGVSGASAKQARPGGPGRLHQSESEPGREGTRTLATRPR